METICAIATPSGGALGIIRVSGPEAILATSRIFRPVGKTRLEEKKGGTLTFGHIVDPQSGEVVDEVLVSLFRAPHSYTGEDSTELSCHGSQYILSKVIELLIGQGCRMARPGEYTQRAFLNGKMDLSQAEGVADLIASTTSANHRMAMSQMRGGFSKELRQLRDDLLHITTLLELELDFSDHEDLEFASRADLRQLAEKIHAHLKRLCQSFRVGNALKRGVPVAIVGETNAGKSTLLNALINEERALVSNIHGTTRDTIEETSVVGDTLVRFIDTAGIRQTTDEVERMGIDRTFAKMHEAEIVLWLIDLTETDEQWGALADKIFQTAEGKQLVILLNKQDLFTSQEVEKTEKLIEEKIKGRGSIVEGHTPIVRAISAKSSETRAFLENIIANLLASLYQSSPTSETIVSNARHYEALSLSLSAIDRVLEAMQLHIPADLISQDLRECIHHLSEIIGEITPDAVLQNVFAHFCIGK